MKIPMPPPSLEVLVDRIVKGSNASRIPDLVMDIALRYAPADPYLPWDEVRYKTPPDGMTTDEWWFTTKIRRKSLQRILPFVDVEGNPFTYAITDEVFKSIEYINRHLSGTIGVGEKVADAENRDSYLVSSLIEEAITSSQLEGAMTTRAVAKEMIRSGRPPLNRHERMILNNYNAMVRIGQLRHESVTLDLLREIQRIVTDGTLPDPTAGGRFQLPGEERVGVYDQENNLLHRPPPAELIPAYAAQLCEFANAPTDAYGYTPPVIRAIVAHFMVGYVRPFEDGNGRTARALFYWLMLREDYWLTEFMPISRILRKAPAKYGRSYLCSEQDDNDLTYFILYQLSVIKRAVVDLNSYLERKIQEAREFQQSVALIPGVFNY